MDTIYIETRIVVRFTEYATVYAAERATVYATFVILKGPVHSKCAFPLGLPRRSVDSSFQDDKSRLHRRAHHNMGCFR
jgi:hypothetical protein